MNGSRIRRNAERSASGRDAQNGANGQSVANVQNGANGQHAPSSQTSHDHKQQRQQAIRQLIATRAVGSQREVVDALSAQGFEVTQATVSRDITELGLVKGPGVDGDVYIAPAATAPNPVGSDARLERILADIPVAIGRSGLILVLVGTPGTASVIAQAIDESTLHEQEGTLAGDNTLLVLFADESRLGRWLERFQIIQTRAGGSSIP